MLLYLLCQTQFTQAVILLHLSRNTKMRQNETKSPNLISSCIHVSKPRRTSYLLVVPVVLLASWLPHLVCTLIFIHQQVRMFETWTITKNILIRKVALRAARSPCPCSCMCGCRCWCWPASTPGYTTDSPWRPAPVSRDNREILCPVS